MSGFKAREEVIDVQLANILEAYGFSTGALVRFNGIPDIYMIIRGLRFIIEAKDAVLEHMLLPQLEDRINKNLGNT